MPHAPAHAMEIVGTGEALVGCDARRILETVLNPTKYRLADRKLGRLVSFSRQGDRGCLRAFLWLRGIPIPPIELCFELTPYRRLDVWSAPSPLFQFRGEFQCEQLSRSTWVQHRERLAIHPAVGWAARLLLGRWLEEDTRAEVQRLKQLLESEIADELARFMRGVRVYGRPIGGDMLRRRWASPLSPTEIMMQPDTSSSETVNQLNSFLRSELSAVETYRQALDKLGQFPERSTLEECARSHRQRVQLLTEEVRKRGGEPAQSSGAWGTFATLMQKGASVFGEKAAIYALEEGEDHGRDDYRRDIDSLEPTARTFVQSQLMPEQQRTHDTISRIKKTMS